MEDKQKYQLTNTGIDEISEAVGAYLQRLNTEKRNLLCIRLLAEEMLLDWQEHFGTEAYCCLRMGKRLGRPYIQLELEGERYDPLEKAAEDYGSYRSRLLASMGLAPVYSYERSTNRLSFQLKRAKKSPMVSLAIAVLLALLVGFGGTALPVGVQEGVLNRILTPIYDSFFNLLGVIAGPMVFLSVAWGIYGVGDASAFGRIGKRMIGHFLGMVFLIGAATALLSLGLFSLKVAWQGGGISQLDSLFKMILDFIPSDLFTPFQEGNSLQIILMGAAVGLALLVLGKQVEAVARGIEQINYVIQLLMEVISRLVPFFIFIVLVQMIWSGTLNAVLAAWKPVLVFVLAMLLLSLLMTVYAAARTRISPLLLLKKSLPTGVIAVTTASSVAAFGSCTFTCEQKLGVDKRMTSFGVPLGVVMFPPGTAMYFLIICIYMAEAYAIQCSPVWFLLAIFTSTVLAIAAPPIPGGTLTCYTILFTQLGLPEEALAVALALDVLFDFMATGVNMYTLQMELLIQARRMKMLNLKILQKKGK